MAFPGTVSQRVLYNNAKRVVDELGKGQEVLRVQTASVRSVSGGATKRAIVLIPDVDIILVDVLFAAEGAASADVAELLAPAAYDTGAGSTNRLVTQVTAANIADDTVFRAALTNLNGRRVAAGQPIVLVATEVGSNSTIVEAFVQMSYILADDARSY